MGGGKTGTHGGAVKPFLRFQDSHLWENWISGMGGQKTGTHACKSYEFLHTFATSSSSHPNHPGISKLQR
jgi:hypothetical protein